MNFVAVYLSWLRTLAARAEAIAWIAAGGLVTAHGGPHPFLMHSRQPAQRAESLLARYGLAAQGGPDRGAARDGA